MSAGVNAWLYATAVILVLIAPAGTAAQEQTEPERLLAQLKESEEPGARQVAERWRELVRQRVWTDHSGKYKVYARYVSHDPAAESVTLLVLQRSGDTQSYKATVVPLAKLGKSEQAVVKRIEQLRKDVDAKLAGTTNLGGETDEPGAEAPADVASGYGAPAAGYERYENRGAPETAEEAPELPAIVLAEPWRGSFATFASNLAVVQDESGKSKVSFGALEPLQAVFEMEWNLEQLRKLPQGARPPQAALVQQAMAYGWSRGGLGPIAWEVTLSAPVTRPGTKIQHDLTPPEPFTVTLIADGRDAAAYRQLKAGSKAWLHGYFVSLGGANPEKPELVLRVQPLTAKGQAVAGRPAGGRER